MHPATYGLLYGKDKNGNHKVSVNGGTLLIKKIERAGLGIHQSDMLRLGRFLV